MKKSYINCISNQLLLNFEHALFPQQTRKLSFRKYDRAMRPIYGCPENFRESLSTPIATFAEILIDFCSDRSYECAYKIWSS